MMQIIFSVLNNVSDCFCILKPYYVMGMSNLVTTYNNKFTLQICRKMEEKNELFAVYTIIKLQLKSQASSSQN